MGSLANLPFGAFTPTAAAAIQAAIQQSVFGTGKVFYLDPVNGSDAYDGSSPSIPAPGQAQGPLQSLLAGYNALRSGYNDTLVIIGNGTASGSVRITSFTWAKNATRVVGICAPSAVSQRARIANPTTAGLVITANFFTVSGNGCLFQNLSWFQGAGAGQTGIAAAICLTVSGQRNAFINCDVEGMGDSTAATDAGSRNVLLSAGENYFQHCNIGLDTVTRTNANASVEISNNAARNIFENCTFPIYSSDGLQYILLVANAAGIDRFVAFRACLFMNALGSGSTILAVLFKLAASAGGVALLDIASNWIATAIGDATTKAQVYMGGVAGVATGGKMIVAS